ncbi:hypothetical protein F2Q70_00008977 [Brassica cretica]|uniref:Uncharacterized protein n=1 Tax=Brassica cretica TaxID=69181 RepID=A0A8S9M0W8_BRACR|nr:hypothetical protein F2Q70_00008977 [Brassica cretica]
MQPDILEEWWRPACVLDMQPAMWSTRCRRACVRSHAKRHTGCHQPEADWLLSSINRHDLPSVSTHPHLSKLTPREGSVQMNSSRPVSFYMVKPRFCPSRDQSSPVQSRHPLGFGQVLSDQPAASRLEHCRGVNFVTLAGSSLSRQVALLDHGVGLDGQSCSCLIVGWPVGSFISNPGCWTVDRSCSCLIVGRLIDHISRTVRECYSSSILSNGGSGGSGPTTLLNMFPVAVSSLVTAS